MHIVVGDFGRDGRCWFLLLGTIIWSYTLGRRLWDHLKGLFVALVTLRCEFEDTRLMSASKLPKSLRSGVE